MRSPHPSTQSIPQEAALFYGGSTAALCSMIWAFCTDMHHGMTHPLGPQWRRTSHKTKRCPYQRKFSKTTSVIRKVESQDPDALRSEVSTENREGYLCSACGSATGSPRSRHGGGMLPTGTAAQTVFFGGFSEVYFAWQVQHFGNLRCRFRGMRNILCPCKVKCRFRGRRSIFAKPSTDFVASAALSQGQVIDR